MLLWRDAKLHSWWSFLPILNIYIVSNFLSSAQNTAKSSGWVMSIPWVMQVTIRKVKENPKAAGVGYVIYTEFSSINYLLKVNFSAFLSLFLLNIMLPRVHQLLMNQVIILRGPLLILATLVLILYSSFLAYMIYSDKLWMYRPIFLKILT